MTVIRQESHDFFMKKICGDFLFSEDHRFVNASVRMPSHPGIAMSAGIGFAHLDVNLRDDERLKGHDENKKRRKRIGTRIEKAKSFSTS